MFLGILEEKMVLGWLLTLLVEDTFLVFFLVYLRGAYGA